MVKIRHDILRHLENPRWFYALAVLFRVILELSYRDFVFPWFEYAGFTLVDNPLKYAESWLLYAGLLSFLPARARKPSDFLVCLAFFAFLAPLLVFYGLADKSRWMLYYVLIQYCVMSVLRAGRPIRMRTVKYGPAMALGASIAGIIVATAWMVASGGFAHFNLDLDAVYEFREETASTIFTGPLGYVVVWATTVCSPLLLMLALRNRNHVLVLGMIFLHVLWFGLTSHKSVLFYPALVLFLRALFKYSRALALIPVGMSLAVMISLISFYATESLFLSGMFVRRVFFVPSYLTFTYLEFFNENPLVFWSNSFLSWLVHYPYDESVALVIGSYLNDPTTWANNSFFSTGYMHAGLLGVVIYGLVSGVMLKILDSLVTKNVPIWMALAVTIVPWFSLFTSADLTTTLLTHGLGFGILVLYLMRHKDWAHDFEGGAASSQSATQGADPAVALSQATP